MSNEINSQIVENSAERLQDVYDQMIKSQQELNEALDKLNAVLDGMIINSKKARDSLKNIIDLINN